MAAAADNVSTRRQLGAGEMLKALTLTKKTVHSVLSTQNTKINALVEALLIILAAHVVVVIVQVGKNVYVGRRHEYDPAPDAQCYADVIRFHI